MPTARREHQLHLHGDDGGAERGVTSASTSIAEVGTAVASGTFANYDDAVTITASQGQHQPVGQPERDMELVAVGLDEGSYTVTITATNADGNASSTSFTFTDRRWRPAWR